MKKMYIVLLISFLISGSNLIAQKIGNFYLDNIYSSRLDSIQNKADSLVSFLKKDYTFLNEEVDKNSFGNSKTYKRYYKNSEGRLLRIVISSGEGMGNPALEIKGKSYFSILSIDGKFKDLFDIWHLLNPSADLIKASKNDYNTDHINRNNIKALANTNSLIYFQTAPFFRDGSYTDVWSIMFMIDSFLKNQFANRFSFFRPLESLYCSIKMIESHNYLNKR